MTATAPIPEDASLPLANARELARVRLPEWPRYVIGLGVVAYGVFVVSAVVTATFELVEAVPLIGILAYVAHVIARRIAAADRDPSMASFVFAAFWAKMLGTILRSVVTAELYGNRSDALDYHQFGQSFAPQFRVLNFSSVTGTSGTDFMRVLTGVIYSFTGASQMSGAVVLSFMSFIGLLLLWRAFKLAVPNGATYRYGVLVLFLPSFLYWPSALGKEGWAILCLGLASYGVAKVLTRSVATGVVLFIAGLVGVAQLRPHVAITIFCGVLLAAAVGKSQRPGVKASSLRLILFGALLVGGLVLVSSTASFFGVPRLDQETINTISQKASGATSEAGSAFTPVAMTSNPPYAIVTVLVRPFPYEASSVVAVASSFEGVFLVVLAVRSWRRLRSLGRSMRRQPYVGYCIGITLSFVFAFSAFSNFGILARQRCQVLPFFLALICLPLWESEQEISTEEALAGRDQAVPGPGSPFLELAPDPAAPPDVGRTHAPSPDPYTGADLGIDPYERFRDPPDPYHHDDD